MSGIAGTLRERVMRLEEGGRNAAGAAGEPAPGAAAWAAIVPLPAGPAVLGDRMVAARRWRVRMRRQAAPMVGSHLRWRGRTLVVLSRTDDPRDAAISEMIAEERAE
ncbi:hypothetical protein [Pacificimonas flava]|uniref:Uncharacterized protein n=1 Tax=Pacificimonas flava TaxID=1234595 RepID=M2T7H8_9SPHN|nr:hypothetical protein [Pacificimonas flava]EMD82479.1 hypothetical protein C725_2200 [Pacificimonas flava]MBB5281311.1 hypothetical protein [Pacificimonas flava]